MQTLGYWTLRVAVWRWLLLVDPRVFWAPGPAVGPGCAVGGPAASCPRHKLRSTLRLVIRPGPSAQLWLPTSNSARNSSMTHSNIEFVSLELQRFWGISKNDRNELRAKFGWRWCQRLPLRPSLPRASIGASARCPARPHGSSSTLHADGGGGFALHEALWRRVVGVSDPHVVQFPPFGDGQATA